MILLIQSVQILFSSHLATLQMHVNRRNRLNHLFVYVCEAYMSVRHQPACAS